MNRFYFTPFLNEVFYDLLSFTHNRSISFEVLMRQILFSGLQSLSLVSLISLLMGAVIIVQGHQLLNPIGQTNLIYDALIAALIRDMGPFIVSFVIIARSGTAIATELGNMVVNRELDALRVMGVSPISYLVSPRVLSLIISQLLLMIYFVVIGLFGGYLVSNLFLSLPIADFINHIANRLTPGDLLTMTFKAALSGLLIGVICCYEGLNAGRAYTEVPKRVIKGVGRSTVVVCIINIIGMAGQYYLGIIL